MQGSQQRGHAKFEEYKPCDDERALLDSLKTFKSIRYAFEVDGQVVINTNDSYSTQPDIACQKYKKLNEKKIESHIDNMAKKLQETILAKKREFQMPVIHNNYFSKSKLTHLTSARVSTVSTCDSDGGVKAMDT